MFKLLLATSLLLFSVNLFSQTKNKQIEPYNKHECGLLDQTEIEEGLCDCNGINYEHPLIAEKSEVVSIASPTELGKAPIMKDSLYNVFSGLNLRVDSLIHLSIVKVEKLESSFRVTFLLRTMEDGFQHGLGNELETAKKYYYRGYFDKKRPSSNFILISRSRVETKTIKEKGKEKTVNDYIDELYRFTFSSDPKEKNGKIFTVRLQRSIT